MVIYVPALNGLFGSWDERVAPLPAVLEVASAGGAAGGGARDRRAALRGTCSRWSVDAVLDVLEAGTDGGAVSPVGAHARPADAARGLARARAIGLTSSERRC